MTLSINLGCAVFPLNFLNNDTPKVSCKVIKSLRTTRFWDWKVRGKASQYFISRRELLISKSKYSSSILHIMYLSWTAGQWLRVTYVLKYIVYHRKVDRHRTMTSWVHVGNGGLVQYTSDYPCLHCQPKYLMLVHDRWASSLIADSTGSCKRFKIHNRHSCIALEQQY
jgi:hypothetical protein